ncbi:hypothetical protein [Baekduia sp.]|uniref:hypothetical protein n=1 Tax=Baekduia sp. TaxID=2600305 RepID=UPI002E069B0E|nr:hypothetical protein [Baekduia sp.]
MILLLFPAAGRASDPLLSGYAGPGGGEQVVLGGGMVGGGGGTSGDGAAATGDESLRATGGRDAASAAAPNTSGTLTDTPQRRKSSSSPASHPKTMSSGSTTTNSLTGAPQTVAYPTRAGAVGGLPISAGGILALVAAIALFFLAAVGLRRLSVGSEDAPRRPQVSSS